MVSLRFKSGRTRPHSLMFGSVSPLFGDRSREPISLNGDGIGHNRSVLVPRPVLQSAERYRLVPSASPQRAARSPWQAQRVGPPYRQHVASPCHLQSHNHPDVSCWRRRLVAHTPSRSRSGARYHATGLEPGCRSGPARSRAACHAR